MKQMMFLVLAGAAAVLGTCTAARAGVITAVQPPAQSVSVSTPAPNDDQTYVAGLSLNFITYVVNFQSEAPVDVVINVDNSLGVTLYDFIVPLTPYASGPDWSGVQLELIYDDEGGLGGPNFDLPETHADPKFRSYGATHHSSTVLRWEDLTLLAGNSADASFSVNVPDGGESGASGYNFTIRHTPLVPEPTTATLLLGSSLALLCTRCRKHR